MLLSPELISRNCFIEAVPDETGNNCLMYNSTASAMPNYMVDPLHYGLPQFIKTFQGSTGALNFLLDNNGGSPASLTNPCTTLTGAAQAFFFTGSSTYGNNIGGNAGLQENVPGVPTGSMFSAYIGIPGLSFGTCASFPSLPCGGLDAEGEGPQANFTPTSSGDATDIVTTTGSLGTTNVWFNGVQTVTNFSQGTLATQNRMSWGATGDHTVNGPAINRTEAFFGVNLSSGQQAALYSNEQTFIGTLTTGYTGPGDIPGLTETSASIGLASTGRVLQLQWLSQCFSLRKCYAGYEGPAINVCQGSGSCEDIGWVNNAIDLATMNAFCGSGAGNNCAVQIWYNQALNQNSTINGVGTSLDATAVSSSNRPAVLFSGCQTTAITACISTTATNYFILGGGPLVFSSTTAYTMSAVATRTSGTSTSSIFSSATGTGPETFLGFTTANTCKGTAQNGGGGSTLACTDGTIHSITYDVQFTLTKGILYVDGTANSPATNTLGYSSVGLGVGATSAGLNTCTCQISEVLLYADSHNSSYEAGMGSTLVAALRANQRAAFGF